MMMKLLLLLLLLAPCSASLQDIVKKSSQHKHALEEGIPEITAFRSTLTYQRILPPSEPKQKRQAEPSSSGFNIGQLKWQAWNDSLPNGSVSIHNEYVGRVDYVCKYLCHAGFFHLDLGPYCHYTYGDTENRVHLFEILVNQDNFKILEWKDGTDDLVPENSVRTCSSDTIYVGKNKYGLGKVDPKSKAFYLPWKGSQYSYNTYQALTINMNVIHEHMSNVTYITDKAKLSQHPPETMRIVTITNNECNPVAKTATFSSTIWVEHRWDFASPIKHVVNRTFISGIPSVMSGSIQVGTEVSFKFSEKNSVTQEFSQSVFLEVKVPANHNCRVTMLAKKYKVNIPFTAHLSRTYSDGKNRQTAISGSYDSIQIGEVHSGVDRCEPIPDAKPCPLREI